MYKHNIYTKPGLIGFGNYQGMGASPIAAKKTGVLISAPVVSKRIIDSGVPGDEGLATGLDALPTWAYIAIPVGVVAVAAVVYYKFF